MYASTAKPLCTFAVCFLFFTPQDDIIHGQVKNKKMLSNIANVLNDFLNLYKEQ
jgi:hypothetical protein